MYDEKKIWNRERKNRTTKMIPSWGEKKPVHSSGILSIYPRIYHCFQNKCRF